MPSLDLNDGLGPIDFDDEAELFLLEGNKIRTIKMLRVVTALGLKEAKDYVESVPFANIVKILRGDAKLCKNCLELATANAEQRYDSRCKDRVIGELRTVNERLVTELSTAEQQVDYWRERAENAASNGVQIIRESARISAENARLYAELRGEQNKFAALMALIPRDVLESIVRSEITEQLNALP